MTCIAGVEYGGRVWIGGDSATMDEKTRYIQASPKVFRRDPFIVGACGDLLWCSRWERIQFVRKPPVQATRIEAWVRETIFEQWAALGETDNTGESAALIAIRGMMFVVEECGATWRPRGGYCAIGSGGDIALGSLYTTAKRKLLPKYRIRLALEASSHHSADVAPPFTVLST